MSTSNPPVVYNVNGHDFDMDIAGVIGYVNEEGKFMWAIDLYAKQGNYEGQRVQPKFSFTELAPAPEFTYDKSFKWPATSAYDDDRDEWVGSFYIFDASYFECSVQFKRLGKDVFHAHVKGKVNMNWESVEGQQMEDFEISAVIPFNGILSDLHDEKEVRRIASEYLDVESLNWLPQDRTANRHNSWLVF